LAEHFNRHACGTGLGRLAVDAMRQPSKLPAIALGMSRATIYRKMRDYGIA
jgi:transcriptional regulator of acetoin/glycerol metabolism